METLLQRLLAVEGVVGAVLINRDGLVLASLMAPERAAAHAAPAAAAFDALATYARLVAAAAPRVTLLEAGATTLALAEAGDLLVVAEAAAPANLGRLRLEMVRVAADVQALRRR